MRMNVQLNFRKAYDIELTSPHSQKIFREVEVIIHSVRQDNPVQIASINYELIGDTDENDHRLEFLHAKVRKYDTDLSTLAVANKLDSRIRRNALVF